MSHLTRLLQERFTVNTFGRSTVEVSYQIDKFVRAAAINTGFCHVFLHHTSASLIICENADIDVQTDLETFMSGLVKDGDPAFIHTTEGDDDMPAHIRSVLTQTELTIPISEGRLALGIWQGIYLWEHRTSPYSRNITLTMAGQ